MGRKETWDKCVSESIKISKMFVLNRCSRPTGGLIAVEYHYEKAKAPLAQELGIAKGSLTSYFQVWWEIEIGMGVGTEVGRTINTLSPRDAENMVNMLCVVFGCQKPTLRDLEWLARMAQEEHASQGAKVNRDKEGRIQEAFEQQHSVLTAYIDSIKEL